MMNTLEAQTILITGGSKGLGRSMVKSLAATGATVWALARNTADLKTLVDEVGGVKTYTADVTDPQTASKSLREIRPTVLILNAGAIPHMAPVHEQTWEQFSHNWDTDVKASFLFGREALLTPMQPGSTVILVSSGAAYGGSMLSGSYASAKRAQLFLTQYLQHESNRLQLGLRFMALVPRQIVGTTAIGSKAVAAYASSQGITQQQFLERMGHLVLTEDAVGQSVVTLLTDATMQGGMAYGLNSQGLSLIS